MAHVLLINDEPDLVEICRAVLEAAGHSVYPLVSPRSLDLEPAADWRPDVVLLDFVMPASSGEQVYRRLRRLPNTSNVPIVVMSAMQGTEERAKQLGAAGYLEKPFDPDALIAAINKALAQLRDRGPRPHDGSPVALSKSTSH